MCSNESIDERISRLASVDSASQSITGAAARKTHQNPQKLANLVEISTTAISSVDNPSLLQQLQKTSPYHRHSQSAVAGSNSGPLIHPHQQHHIANMSSMLGGNTVVPPGILPPLDHYRLQLYNYAVAERLRCSQYSAASAQLPICGPGYPTVSAANSPYAPSRFALSMSFFHNRVFQPEEPKPQHSYIGLIAMAILNSPETKLVLSDIYQHILDNYPYFRTRGPGWRNSIRHNLSLNDCFIKAGRSANGKGHYWAIHPANLEDFKKGDFRRRKAQRKVRKHMGLAVDDEGTDSSSPPPLALTPPPPAIHPQSGLVLGSTTAQSAFCAQSWAAAVHAQAQAAVASTVVNQQSPTSTIYSQSSRKRQFDVASLLAPDDDENDIHRRGRSRSPSLPFVESSRLNRIFHRSQPLLPHADGQNQGYKGPVVKRLATAPTEYDDSENEDIDVVASDAENNNNNNYSHGNNIPEDNVRFVLGLNENVVEDDEEECDEECIIEDDSHKEDIADEPQQYQSRQQHHHHHQFEQDPQMQQHQPKTSFAVGAGGDEDNQLTEGSNDSNPGAGHSVTTTAAAAAAAASWQGIIQQWPSNFQQHFNNIATPAGAVNTRFLQRYYGQYMAAAAAQHAAVAAVTAKTTQQSGRSKNTNNKDTSSDVKLVELNSGIDPMALISREADEQQQKPELQQQIHPQLPSVASMQHQDHEREQQQPQMHHHQSCNSNSLKILHGGNC